MIWQDWLLLYLTGGITFVLIRYGGEEGWIDARNLALSVLIWVVFPFTYIWYRYDKRKRELERQQRLAVMVRDGEMAEERAKSGSYNWNGKPAK